MTSTSATLPTAANSLVLFTVPITLLIGVSTGNLWPFPSQQGTGGTVNQYNLQDFAAVTKNPRPGYAAPNAEPATTAEDIDYIKGSLRLTTTELAKYLGVSRQAIYDWRSGRHVKSHNISKLENLREAAGVIANSGSEFSSVQINRKLPGGHTLLETIALGGNGYEAAQSLVTMLSREMQQRKDRGAKVADRKPITESEFSFGMAALREGG